MSLVAIRSAIVDAIEAGVPTFASVAAHGGKFSAIEVRRVASKSPACMVAVIGIKNIERQGGMAVGQVQFGAFVATQGTSTVQRDASALILSEAIIGLAATNAWDYADAKAPQGMRADNLFSGTVDKLAVALWAVFWTQEMDLSPMTQEEMDAIDDFHRLHVDTDLAPMDGVIEDEQDIWLHGTLMSAYGQLYVSSAAATGIAAADTFQKANGTTTLHKYDGMDMPVDNRLRHTDAVTRPMLVQVKASISVSTDAEVQLAVAKNGTVIDESSVAEDLAAADGAEAMACDAIIELGENDYIEAWVTADDTVSVTLEKMTMVAVAT